MAQKNDISVWTVDNVRSANLGGILQRHQLTEEDAGVPGGIAEYLRRVSHTKGEVQKDAKARLDAVMHTVLNLMRKESNLDYTDEASPSKWSAEDLMQVITFTGRVQKRVAGKGDGVQSADQLVWIEKVVKEEGWGNDYAVNSNPPNSEGEKNTTDPRPGWWYRMVADEHNREAVLSALFFWEPEKVEDERDLLRLDDPDTNPNRKVGLKITKKSKEKFRPEAKRDGEESEKRHKAILKALEDGSLTRAAIAHKYEVSVSTVDYVRRKFQAVPSK
jgi:hypothetical protein